MRITPPPKNSFRSFLARVGPPWPWGQAQGSKLEVQHIFWGRNSAFFFRRPPAPLPSHAGNSQRNSQGTGSRVAVPSPRVRGNASKTPKTSQRRDFGVGGVFLLFYFIFFFLLGGGWGGNRGRGAEHRAGLNFSLMCLAEELTVRNTTGFHRKENTVRYLNISRLHHQHRSQLWR